MMRELIPGPGMHDLMGIATDIMVPYRLSVLRCQATRLTADPARARTYIASHSTSPFANRVHLANSAHESYSNSVGMDSHPPSS